LGIFCSLMFYLFWLFLFCWVCLLVVSLFFCGSVVICLCLEYVFVCLVHDFLVSFFVFFRFVVGWVCG